MSTDSTDSRAPHEPYMPTEAEIAERAAEIRRGWSEQEHFRRAGIVSPGWIVPEVEVVGDE